MKLFVGNLNYALQEQELEALFSQYGEVNSVKIIMDRESGRSRGFGFVEMSDDSEGQRSIDELDGFELKGRSLKVSQAVEKSGSRPGGGGSFNRNRY